MEQRNQQLIRTDQQNSSDHDMTTTRKTAILSVSKRGAELGQRIKRLVAPLADCYEKEGRQSGGEAIYFTSLKSHMGDIFKNYDQVLCIMAIGIVVRMIAPYIEHKSKDPAIVVMDEMGQHTISLLSGHLGGANEWASAIALAVDSDPVITTATDVNGLAAPDVWARQEHLVVEDFQTLIAVNSAIVAGTPVNYYIDESLPNFENLRDSAIAHLKEQANVYSVFDIGKDVDYSIQRDETRVTLASISMGKHMAPENRAGNAPSIEDRDLEDCKTHQYSVLVTDKIVPYTPTQLVLRPKTFTMGIGCRRDTPKELILEAITKSLEIHQLSQKSILTAASVIVKQDEIGLLEAVKELNWPIVFYTQEEMAPVIESQELQESTFVKGTIGVGNVCETTALLAAKSHTLIQQKTVYPKTTIAIAQVTSK